VSRQTLVLGVLTCLNLGISLLSQLYVIGRLGAGQETDAFFGGATLPSLVSTVLSGALASVVVPLLAGNPSPVICANARRIFVAVGLAMVALAVPLWFTTPAWLRLLVPGLAEDGRAVALSLARVQLFTMVFTPLQGVVTGSLYARKRFLLAEAVTTSCGLVSFGLLVATLTRYGIIVAAWTTVSRALLPMLLLLPTLISRESAAATPGVVADLWKKLLPLLLGSAYYRSGMVVDGFLSSLAPRGHLSMLFLAERLLQALNEVVRRAAAVPAVSLLTECAKAERWRDYRRHFLRGLAAVTGYALLIQAAIAIAGLPALRLLSRWGAMSGKDVFLFWILLVALGGYLAAGCAGLIQAGGWYSRGDTATPAKIGMLTFTVGAGLRILGFYAMGVVGIALAISLQYLLASVLHARWDPEFRKSFRSWRRLRRRAA
jgi:putative peptidoglycan lipid II flippase